MVYTYINAYYVQIHVLGPTEIIIIIHKIRGVNLVGKLGMYYSGGNGLITEGVGCPGS